MDQQQQANIFRLSAILFANDNYTISPVQLHRKVVEDALYQLNEPNGITIEGLADYIGKKYLIDFTDKEIEMVLHNQKFITIFESMPISNTVVYRLRDDRRKILDGRKPKTLDDFIQEFIQLKDLPAEAAETIYRYLYGVFTTNVDGFRRMTEAGNVKELTQHYSPNEKDAEIINGFLDWENDEKNIAIFNLASYALEYCLLTSKKGTHLKLEKLTKKVFYLDTNILYRALGINGKDRQLRTHSFLRKLVEAEDEIKITKVAWDEYQNSLDKYIKRLRRDESPAVHSKVYTEYVTYDDIHRSYHLWASANVHATVDLFVNTLKAELLQLVEDYHIKIDSLCPFDKQQKEEDLKDMAIKIKSLSEHKYFETAYNDARDILWVDMCRKPGEENIFSTKTFLLSSDRGLFRWDSKYYWGQTPVVMLPSQWLSILLRYVSRTTDDFRSFVSFLNIQNKEGVLTAEQISAILSGISDMTDKVEQQRYLLDVIIDSEFKSGAAGKTNEQLKAIAKKDANRILQQQLSEVTKEAKSLRKDLASVKSELEVHKSKTEKSLSEKDIELNAANEKISELRGSINTLTQAHETAKQTMQNQHQKEMDDAQKKIESLKKELDNTTGLHAFMKHRRKKIAWRVFWVVLVLGLIAWFILSSPNCNEPMGWLLKWIEGLDETRKFFIRGTLLFLVSLVLVPLCISLWNTYHSKYGESKKEK